MIIEALNKINYRSFLVNEEKELTKILTEFLGREPNKKDAVLCKRVYRQGEYKKYSFYYGDKKLGELVSLTLSIKFIKSNWEKL